MSSSIAIQSLKNWNNSPAPPSTAVNSPTLTKATLSISTEPTDTFITTAGWGDGNRGVVFVNGFNVGRFSGIGPTKTLYIPAPLLSRGDNTVRVSIFLFNSCLPLAVLAGKISTESVFTCRFWFGPCSSP
jgi:hypothetical protein